MYCRFGDVLCATHPCNVCDVCWRLEIVLYALETLEGMRRRLLCMLGAMEDELCLLKVMCCVLLCILEAPEGGVCLLEVF